MRSAIVALLVMVALAGVQAQMKDLSLLQLSSLPAEPTASASEQSVIDRLHSAAGEWADEAIAEAVHALPSQDGSLLEAASHSAMQSKWDESIPEVHLHMDAPEDKLLHGLAVSTAEPATSDSEIKQIMESFQTPALIEAKAKAAAQEKAQAQAAAKATESTVASTQAKSDSTSDSEILTDAEAEAGVVTMSELKNMMELEGMTAQQIEAYMENLGQTEVEAEAVSATSTEAEAEAETEVDAEAQSEAVASAEAQGEAEMDAEHEAVADAETEATEEVGMVETESESESEAEAESESESEADAESEEAVPVHDHADPTTLSESAESTVTPVHSADYERRMHPAIRAVRNAGYGMTAPPTAAQSFVQTAQRTRVASANPAFNPQSVQLGPSKDAYGYAPMTGAEFLRSPPQPSLAQMSMQYQPHAAAWLPPPIESQAVPNYVVGPGGLRPNVNAGPYAGQYGIAAGGIEMHQEPQFQQ